MFPTLLASYIACYFKDYSKIDLDNMYNGIKFGLQHSIDEYKEDASSHFSGWFLRMDQQVLVNGKSTSGSLKTNKLDAAVIKCPENKKLTIVHCFQSQEFVPIPNTPFKIIVVKPRPHVGSDHTIMTEPNYEEDKTVDPLMGQVDANGRAEIEVPGRFKGKALRIIFEPDITQADLDTLFNSYSGTVAKLSDWLDDEWKKQKVKWEEFQKSGMSVSHSMLSFIADIGNELIIAWDDIKALMKVMLEPFAFYKLLYKLIKNPEIVQKILNTCNSGVNKMMTLLQDEARMFILVKAIYCRIKLSTPQQMEEIKNAGIAMILVNAVICWVAGLESIAGKILVRALDYGSVASLISPSTN